MFSNAHKYDPPVYHFTLLCKALAHPARVIIIKKLMSMEDEWATPAFLRAGLPLARQTLSDHLTILRQMSIVNCEVRGRHILYSMNPKLVNTFFGLFALVSQAELKYDESYQSEIEVIGVRRKIGTTPY